MVVTRMRNGCYIPIIAHQQTNLVVLGIFDGLWSMSDEQLEGFKVVHHGRPVECSPAIVVCGCYVSILLDEHFEHVLVDHLDSRHERGDAAVGLLVQVSLGVVEQNLWGDKEGRNGERGREGERVRVEGRGSIHVSKQYTIVSCTILLHSSLNVKMM